MRRQLAILILAALGVVGGFGALLFSCNRPPASQQDVGTRDAGAVDGVGERSLEFRAPDDPQNPYAQQYREWDRWVFDHLTDWKSATSMESDAPDFRFVTVHLDQAGFILPQLEEERQKRELIKSGSDQTLDDLFKCNCAAAVGVMDPVMWASLEEAIDRLVEPYFPPIPEWVADALPKKAILLPEGYVAALDGLGSSDPNAPKDSDCDCENSPPAVDKLVPAPDGSLVIAREAEHWYLYDPAGKLLDEGPLGWWFLMYRSKHGDNWPSGRPDEIGLDGYSEWKDPDTGKILSAWGWDGNATPPGVNPAPRDRHYFRTLAATQLRKLIDARTNLYSGGKAHD